MRELENNCELWRIERHLGEGGWLRAKGLWTMKFSFRVSFYSGFKCWLKRFGLVWVNQFPHYKTKTEPNRTEPEFFLNILIGLIGFFFLGSVLSVNFFSVFSVYLFFLLTPSRSLNFFMGSLCKKARSCSWIWNPLGISHWNLCT
jgi:hypothetical protein